MHKASTSKATLLSLHAFPERILAQILGDFMHTTALLTFDTINALIEHAGLRQTPTFVFDYDATLARVHQSLSLPMAQTLVELMVRYHKQLVIVTSAWFDDITTDLSGGYNGQGVNFLQMLPAHATLTVIGKLYDPHSQKTGAKAQRYTTHAGPAPVAGLEDLFEHVWRRHQEVERPAGAGFAKDEVIRQYLKAHNLSTTEMVYFGDSFHTSGSDLPVLDVEGIVAIQVKDIEETLQMLRQCLQ